MHIWRWIKFTVSIRLDQCISGASKLQEHLKVLVSLFQGTTVGPPKFLPPFFKIGCHEVSEDQKAQSDFLRSSQAYVSRVDRRSPKIETIDFRAFTLHCPSTRLSLVVRATCSISLSRCTCSKLPPFANRSIDRFSESFGKNLVLDRFQQNCQSRRVYVVSGTMIESNGNSRKEVSLFLFLSFCLQWRIGKNEMDYEENVYLSLK